MSKQETKRQHYVPETYLNKFGIETKANEYQVFVSRADNIENYFPVNTSKICVQTDLYTLKGETEEERQLIENFYGNYIEGNYNEIYEILTNDNVYEITTKQKDLIIATVITLLFRVTKWLNTHNDFIKSGFERAIELAEQVNKEYFIFEDEKISFKNKDVNQLIKEYKAKNKDSHTLSQLRTAMRLISLRANDRINVIKINDDRYSFITSDNPIVLYNFDKLPIAPFNPQNIISMTLNSKYKLVLYPYDEFFGNDNFSRLIHRDFTAYTEMLVTNYEQYQNAERFIIGDETTLKNFKTFLDNANKPCEETEKQKVEAEKLEIIIKNLGFKE